MRTVRWVLITAALVFGSGCARGDWIDRTLVTVDVTGLWTGRAYITHAVSGLIIDMRFDLQQEGSKVKGTVRPSGSIPWQKLDAAPTTGTVEGTVAGDVFEFRETSGHLTGRLTVGGDEMTGDVVEKATYQVLLRRVP